MTHCSTCAKTFEKRPPHGWKHKGEAYYCPECWRKSYVLRAITMKVASPLDCSWEEFRPLLKAAWSDTTACSNWMMTELRIRDIKRDGSDRSQAKMPAMERVYLYPEARAKFPNLPPQSVASIEQAVQRKYRATRRDVIWTCAASLPTFRYPTPFPVHNQSWSACIDQNKPIVDIRLGEGRQKFRLKGGPHYRRQLAAFRLMARGEAERGELALFQRGSVLLIKMVAWLPRPEVEKEQEGTLKVYTRKDCLLQAVNGKDEALWTYNGDHLRRWIAEHLKQLQRWSEDQKFEQRPGHPFKLRPEVATFQARRSAAVEKQHDRMDSACHDIAFQLATYARRRKFLTVGYDDTERGFLGVEAPWYRLRQLIGEKLDYFGIEFDASGPVDSKEPESLAEDTTDAES